MSSRWVQGNLDKGSEGQPGARELLADACAGDHADEPKLWMMRGQIEEQTAAAATAAGDSAGATAALELARSYYSEGRKLVPKSIPLWLLSARLELAAGNMTRARSLLEKARAKNPKCPELWREGCRVELTAGQEPKAKAMMAKALQEDCCPSSGTLWAESIFMEGKAQRKTRGVDALKKCENNAEVRAFYLFPFSQY